MFLDTRSVAAFLLVATVTAAAAGEGSARGPTRQLCPEDAPEGVRLPPNPECHAAAAARPRVSRENGIHEIGGVEVRVGGRIGAQYGIAR
ncbi:hypothetical protein G3T14_05600 [Methylobacterium sp. BTF04]|uniref:hypothetical protein n=1 Tax=Methylobacterium sp. BTF04 TaxID=2708300 RepID=UPI0013D04E48|nr:hypothetical protein [Methylobacterium sp. BTF04]NEU11602.1 hypothetical protein [Methylobacterium sp. BTF04]